MKYSTRATLLVSFSFFIACPTFSQVILSGLETTKSSGLGSCSVTLNASRGEVPGAPGTPYSAVQESTTVQTLADGTHITHTSAKEKMFRDSQGRTRVEQAFCRPPKDEEAVVTTIRDPVAGYAYILDPEKQIAHRYVLKVREPTPPQTAVSEKVTAPAVTRPRADGFQEEDLGT